MIILYKIAVILSWPYLFFYMRSRKRKNKEDISRFNERLGKAKLSRPAGKLLWMHGASVGETISMLPLITRYLDEYPELSIMVTSGTVTSAEIMAKRLPKRAFHQYIPIDNPFYAKRFIKHWQPDAVLWFESDFWPSILSEINRNNIQLALVNGRISDKSFKMWQRFPRFIKSLLKMFTIILGQSENDAERLRALGGNNIHFAGNIKFAALPLPFEEEELDKLQTQINNRKLFFVSSTHNNEEEQFISIFNNLQKQIPDLLMIIAPRHPHRGAEIEQTYQKHNIKTQRRSKGEKITAETQVYIADTLGEMGLFYRLCPIIFVGGSLIPHGGQNFLECLQFRDAVIVGPHMHNFRLLMKLAGEYNAVIQKQNDTEIQDALSQMLTHNVILETQRHNAGNFMANQNRVLTDIFEKLETDIKVKNESA